MFKLKRLLALAALWLACTAHAAVDVNHASAADLDGIKGIGPAMSGRILQERDKGGQFKDWRDLIKRVRGFGEHRAEQFSAQGLTVNGTPFTR